MPVPAEKHGADLAPGSVLRIELQDVVIGVGRLTATCIVLYYYRNCIGNNANHEQSPGRVSLFVPVITTLLSSVAPLSRYRGEGRAVEARSGVEVVQEVAEGRRSSVLERVA